MGFHTEIVPSLRPNAIRLLSGIEIAIAVVG